MNPNSTQFNGCNDLFYNLENVYCYNCCWYESERNAKIMLVLRDCSVGLRHGIFGLREPDLAVGGVVNGVEAL
jgi:hypothetical protein